MTDCEWHWALIGLKGDAMFQMLIIILDPIRTTGIWGCAFYGDYFQYQCVAQRQGV